MHCDDSQIPVWFSKKFLICVQELTAKFQKSKIVSHIAYDEFIQCQYDIAFAYYAYL